LAAVVRPRRLRRHWRVPLAVVLLAAQAAVLATLAVQAAVLVRVIQVSRDTMYVAVPVRLHKMHVVT
jgi:predicted acyltransferase